MHEIQHAYENEIGELVGVCHRLADDKYVTSHGGNVSWAADRTNGCPVTESKVLITPTKRFKGTLSFDDICITDYDGNILYAPEGGKPTGELPFHLMIYRERPDIASVVHAHPPVTTAFAITDGPNFLGMPLLPEVVTEVGPVCRLPYAEPLTDKLAEQFRMHLDRYDAFLMENHGVTIAGREGPERTRQLLDMIETTAISVVEALNITGGVRQLSRSQLMDLENVRQKRELPLPGMPGKWKSLADCYEFK